MNYGRYFRLNQALSKVVSGVAIYDYVDLPAYFGPSVDNPMSPKYPINVTITSDTISFRLHYSAFKLEKKSNFVEILKNDGKKRLINKEFPQYAYDEEGINNKSLPKVGESGLTDIGMAHMEEVILDLPFADTSSSRLSDTIKKIYNSTFPQVIDENTSMGGRYLEQLIKKRYPIEKDKESENDKGGVEEILYRNLRKMSDETASYSTLWLMDLVRDNRIYLYSKQKIKDDKTKKEKEIDVITGFLRKLLLDFMFDLKHSDVFQNSACYQKMYSGLMSDFFFSALMHKCEYYYYRDLITKKISDGNIENVKEKIIGLYIDNLYRAEELWTQDIMNPNAEKFFEYQFTKDAPPIPDMNIKQWIDRCLVRFHLVEDNLLLRRNSWFEEPEEEMRRVCFPMDERDGDSKFIKKHICNTNILVTTLGLKPNNKIEQEIISFSEKNREIISRWFLRRYDFNDVCHLHLSRWSNLISFSSIFILILIFVLSNYLFEGFIKIIDSSPFWFMWESLFLLFGFAAIIYMRKKQNKRCNYSLLSTYVSQNSQRILNFITFIALSVVIVNINWKWSLMGLLSVFVVCLLCEKSRSLLENILKRLTSYLHLFFPRLVASITTAWLTMSMGFDIYVAFFDQHVSPPTAFMILIIVFIFVMYEINRITPQTQIWKKLLRGFQLVVISYGISLVVGTIVINFVGRQYMDRGDGFGNITFTSGTVDTDTKPHRVIMKDFTFGDLSKDQQKRIMHDVHCENNNCQSITVFHFGEHEVFFMRDFLIMFSFVTMFMGIFLQMFIFEDKKMTEF